MSKQRFSFAMQLIKDIGKELKFKQNIDRIISYKSSELDIVTQFDLEIQQKFVKEIKAKFSSDVVLAEEEGLSDVEPTSATWVLDPIDGTANFAHRLPLYCISLAFYERTEPVFGLIYLPETGDLYGAYKGEGAFLNSSRIRVSNRDEISESLVTVGTTTLRSVELLNLLHTNVRRMRVLGTAALQAAFVAAGFSEAFIGYRLNIWDIAAAYIILKEAGGRVTDWNGKDIGPWNTEKMIFSNGHMLRELCSLISSVGV
ncbi:inositol monophosphatase family protein [Kosmotoga pacifica]|uniref:Inositol-phosphate phosphatase n=1 Tax=Kosmotoga pacifica TaxID=1330330 RepID=A0A0G2ZC46_9BACT|nr:inositol monophosphatase [Kosmotoga pacifica]AKI97139.1 hypothetical protein IX53_04155 [Kosmotoga pacifica]